MSGSSLYSEPHALALLSNGSVIAWGRNDEGQCNVPALAPGAVYVETDAGGRFSLARRGDGSISAWGDNSQGQCNVPGLPAGVVYVEAAAGASFALARRGDGTVVGWGNNASGQCNAPAPPVGRSYSGIDAGLDHAAALLSDGSAVAWGDNTSGQCNVSALPPGLVYSDIEAGWRCSVALRSDGSVLAWGDNSLGQCNVPALPPGTTYVAISAAAEHAGGHPPRSTTMAVRSDGALIVWGDSQSGQNNLPVFPAGLTLAQLSAGGIASIARFGGDACQPPWNYCPAAVNTTGKGARIASLGSTSIGANDFELTVRDVPPRHPGVFFFGCYQTQIPFGEGFLCVTGLQQRVRGVIFVDDLGYGTRSLDFADPSLPESVIEAGSQWNFQFWYRDPQLVGHGFNLSDALSASFCP